MRLLKDFDSYEEKEDFKRMVEQAFRDARERGETNLFIYKLILDELDFFSCVKKEENK